MTEDQPQNPDDRPPHGAGSTPHVTSARLADRWEDEGWRAPLVGAGLGVLTLPTVAMALVGLLVLAVQGSATWLVVTAVALVTTAIGVGGTVVALRRGHPGAVHRLGLLAGVWGVLVLVLGVVLALRLDAPERVAIAVLLVLGGTYTLVLALALWGAARVLPVPVQPADATAGSGETAATGPAAPSRTTAATGQAPTPTAAPDDGTLAEWPEWGGADPAAPEPEVATDPGPPVRPARTESVGDAEVVEPAPGRRTPPTGPRSPDAARTTTSADDDASAASRTPRRRSTTSSGTAGPRRATSAGGPPTERLAPQEGQDGPPTQRLPPVGR